MSYAIHVNGIAHTVDADGDTPLLWVLRDVLGMTGTKFGCGMALCGACTVHLNGVATRSCVTTVESVGNAAITTIEAIGKTPFALQDFPQANGLFISVAVIERVVATCPTCVMLKHEDWPGLDKITALRSREKHGMRRLSILSGNCGIFLPFELARGADGAMTGYAFPEMLVDVYTLMAAGRRSEAHDLFDAHLPLVRYEQQPGVGLAVRKYVLWRRGVLKSDAQRKPGPRVSRETAAEIDFMLERLERATGPRAVRAAS